MTPFHLLGVIILVLIQISLTVSTGLTPSKNGSKLSVPDENVGEGDRVVGGHNIYPNEYSFVVTIRRKDNTTGKYVPQCAGVLIDSWHVLTAAYCLAQVTNMDVAVGQFKIYHDKPSVHQISSYATHPKYRNGSEENNDIGIITLWPEVKSGYSKPFKNFERGDPVGEDCRVLGWGTANMHIVPHALPDELQQVPLKIISNQDCITKLGQFPESGQVQDGMICAVPSGYSNQGPCAGDGGGPLICGDAPYTDESRKKIRLVGLTSWSPHNVPCSAKDFPSVFTRVSKYTQWIAHVLELSTKGNPDEHFKAIESDA